MKRPNLLIAGAAAALSFWLVSNKDKIIQEVEESKEIVTDLQNSYQNIQEQAAILQGYRQPLQELTNQLQYKTRVFQQEMAGHMSEIQPILNKYKKTN